MAKAEVTFKDVGVTLQVPAGTRLIEISEKIGSSVPYGCREGDCGTCLVKVEEGWNNLSAPNVVEHKALRENKAERLDRLACQAQVLEGTVVVRPS